MAKQQGSPPGREEQPQSKPACGAEHAQGDGKTAICVRDMGHSGRMHRAADGFQWFAGGGRGRWRR